MSLQENTETPQPPPIPRSLNRHDFGIERADMTGWFQPMRLVRLALQVVVSVLFGKYADNREMQAALGQQTLFSYRNQDEIWFDYVADLGDGWAPTFTLAKILASETLAVADPEQHIHHTERGQFLIMGGDQVYPSASRNNYKNQTEGPYRAALPWVHGNNQPHLYAIPGNHDWYDGLTSFTRLFCQNRWIGGWKTRQSRSYFAIQLPHHWWLFGFDIQLGADIDKPQLDYFATAINQLTEQDKVIFATPTSAWLTANLSAEDEHENITYLEKRILERKAQVYLNVAGDIHNYAHYQNATGTRHKITAGGGGAFLHYTHTMPRRLEVNEAAGTHPYETADEQLFPPPQVSKTLSLRTLLFVFKNKGISLFLGVYFLLALWVAQSASISSGGNLLATLSHLSDPLLWGAIQAFWAVLCYSPAASLMFSTYVVGLMAFCEPPPEKNAWVSTAKRILLGGIHGLTQLTLSIALTLFFLRLNADLANTALGAIHPTLLLIVQLSVVGSLVSGLVMGLYLYLTHRLFGFHQEAAASCNRIEDYKNFLRFHVDSSGQLTVYAMGIDKVEHHWVLNSQGKPGDTWLLPANGKPMSDYVRLIERPFKIS